MTRRREEIGTQYYDGRSCRGDRAARRPPAEIDQGRPRGREAAKVLGLALSTLAKLRLSGNRTLAVSTGGA
jgi:hypothetical protein